ncbi:MAG: ABC transporter ATP-binding protein [Gammaproteobacteria bacterium]|nr:ABC transporter ATP-binding protein [Gammaproteobacteria bacterium]
MPARELARFDKVWKHFPITGGILKREIGRVNVLNGVDLSIQEDEILGLVGESGCGKSTLAKLLVKLLEPSAGEIFFSFFSEDEKAAFSESETKNADFGSVVSSPGNKKNFRGRDKKIFYRQVQMIFQDPYSSMNPRLKVKDIVGEMIRIQGVKKDEEKRQVRQLLTETGLVETDSGADGALINDVLNKYPHEFSGGQRQRIAIARALIVRPRLLIADEPVSALDLAIQARILALLKNLKQKYHLTILFVSHDLNTVAGFCDRVAVMYLGRLVEIIAAPRLFEHGCHPYLKALLDSIPVPDPALRDKRKKVISGEVPSPINLPGGCSFHPRCTLKIPRCTTECPPLAKRGDEHFVACHCV